MIERDENEAAAYVCNIDNAIACLEIFDRRRAAALPMIDRMIYAIKDGAVDDSDEFRIKLWEMIREHLIFLQENR